jgi:hypothetical protein
MIRIALINSLAVTHCQTRSRWRTQAGNGDRVARQAASRQMAEAESDDRREGGTSPRPVPCGHGHESRCGMVEGFETMIDWRSMALYVTPTS